MLALRRTNEVPACIEGFVDKYRAHKEVVATAADLYGEASQFEQQIALLEELIRRDPERPRLLIQRGNAELKLSRFEPAIATLSKALSLAPEDADARLSRAVAYLGADQFDAARADYEKLLGKPKCSSDAAFGLATIAWRQQNTNSAIGFYQRYLSNAPPRSPQYKVASQRLTDLQNGTAK
jgi:tetratricopeptide (TPR) repeat protein